MRECPVCGSSEIVTDFRDDPDTDETETIEICSVCGHEQPYDFPEPHAQGDLK
jgi:transcription elongation factor Elf1